MSIEEHPVVADLKQEDAFKQQDIIKQQDVIKQQSAVIRTGGKQYRVSAGDTLRIAKLQAEPGSQVHFEDVLFVWSEAGERKILSGSSNSLGVKVIGKFIKNCKDRKVVIFKKRKKGGYTKKQGHRQELSEVVIESIG